MCSLLLTCAAVCALTACGGGGGAGAAKVGACIDAHNSVVACSSSSAVATLASNQSAPNAIACIMIPFGNAKPQYQVKIGQTTYCAQPK
jgi:hypothetical protein